MASAVALGAVIRFIYLLHGAPPTLVLGDGFSYNLEAQRLADGLGYTSPMGDVGSRVSPTIRPVGSTLLAGVSGAGWGLDAGPTDNGGGHRLGPSSLMAGLVGRRYAGPSCGGNQRLLGGALPRLLGDRGADPCRASGLSSSAGALMLVLADLWDRPSVARAVVAGGCRRSALALVRSEQVVLFLVAIAPVLLLNRRIGRGGRRLVVHRHGRVAAVVIAPWTFYNLDRFEEPVILSTNVGSTLLVGNCQRGTYGGRPDRLLRQRRAGELGVLACRGLDRIADATSSAGRAAARQHAKTTSTACRPLCLARYGRTLGVFRPSQTVGFAANVVWQRHMAGLGLDRLVLAPAAARCATGAVILASGEGLSVAPSRAARDHAPDGYCRLRGAPLPHARRSRALVVLAAVGLERMVRAPSAREPGLAVSRARPAARPTDLRAPGRSLGRHVAARLPDGCDGAGHRLWRWIDRARRCSGGGPTCRSPESTCSCGPRPASP